MANGDVIIKVKADTSGLNAGMSSAEQLLKKLTGGSASAESALGSLTGAFGKIAGVIGVAKGAQQLFNDAINSSKTLGNSYKDTVTGMTSVYKEFMYAIANGDFTFFTAGIQTIIDKSNEASAALRSVVAARLSFEYFNSKRNAQIALDRSILTDPSSNGQQRANALKDYNRQLQDMAVSADGLSGKALKAARAIAQATNQLTSVTLKDLEQVISINDKSDKETIKRKRELSRQYNDYQRQMGKENIEYQKRLGIEYIDGYNGMQIRTQSTLSKAVRDRLEKEHAQKIAFLNNEFKLAILFNSLLNKQTGQDYQGMVQLLIERNQLISQLGQERRTYNRSAKRYGAPSTSTTVKASKTPSIGTDSYKKGSLGYIDGEISKLEKRLNSVTTDAMRARISREIEILKKQKEALEKVFKSSEFAKGSIGYYDEQLSALNTKLNKAVTDDSRAAIRAEIKKLTEARDAIAKEAPSYAQGSLDWYDAQLSDLQKQLKSAGDGALRTSLQSKIDELTMAKQEIEQALSTETARRGLPAGAPMPGKDVTDRSRTYELAESKISEIQTLMSTATKAQVGDLERQRDYWLSLERSMELTSKTLTSKRSTMVNDLSQIGSAMTQLGQSVKGSAGAWLSWAGNVSQAVAQAIPAIMALVPAHDAATQAEGKHAAAGAAASVSDIPIVGPFLAVAAVASVVASLVNLPKFARGGVIGGQNYNDGIMARVSSGEMIINQADQRRLFSAINGGGMSGGGVGESRVSGEQIVLAINNYGKRRGAGNIIKL